MAAKWKFLKLLYQQEKTRFLADPEFQRFRQEQAEWLVPYAAFSGLRERFGTADFHQWPAAFRAPHALEQLVDEHGPDFDEFGLHFFTQFHLDKQLRAAVDYGRARQVVLQGDLPIGIYRHSVDAWTQPELYHLDRQAGAPPDDFSDHRPELALPNLQLGAHGPGQLRLVAAAPGPPGPLLRYAAHRPHPGLLPHLGNARQLGRGPARALFARPCPCTATRLSAPPGLV